MTTWETVIAWLADVGERLFKFSRTIAAKAYKDFGDDALMIVMNVALAYATGKTGSEKKQLAVDMLRASAPPMATAATWLVETVVQMAYGEYMSIQAMKDTDGDGILDWKDVCPLLGDAGCGVTPDGCPVPRK